MSGSIQYLLLQIWLKFTNLQENAHNAEGRTTAVFQDALWKQHKTHINPSGLWQQTLKTTFNLSRFSEVFFFPDYIYSGSYFYLKEWCFQNIANTSTEKKEPRPLKFKNIDKEEGKNNKKNLHQKKKNSSICQLVSERVTLLGHPASWSIAFSQCYRIYAGACSQHSTFFCLWLQTGSPFPNL